ncbi:MAG: SUMF1/EgtB/PvdO family nonheme iron enzyme, partial [Pseudomonadota bacterium]
MRTGGGWVADPRRFSSDAGLAMGRIFINYRREDALNWAHHLLYPALATRFGGENVFLDVDSDLPPGLDYRPALREAVERCEVMVSVIGPNWRRILAERTPAHEADPDLHPDSVRVEIAHALSREIPVIPLLVDGAGPPGAAELPEELRVLAFRQSETAAYPSRETDLARLISFIEQRIGVAPLCVPPPETPAAAELARIDQSLDPEAYEDVEEVFRGTPQALEARRRRRQLGLWTALDRGDLGAVEAFAERELFPALAEAAQATATALRDAAERAEVARRGREAAERRAREEAEAERRRFLAWLTEQPAGTVFRDTMASGGEGPEMVVIPAGEFVVGSPEDEPERFAREGPQHQVRIARPFALGRYPVTFDEYDAYCAATRATKPKDEGWGRARRPAIYVSWDDASAYCAWLSSETGADYRLPSEAEWEYGCRAGTVTAFWWGREITPEQANYRGRYVYAGGGAKGVNRRKTEPVDAFEPN